MGTPREIALGLLHREVEFAGRGRDSGFPVESAAARSAGTIGALAAVGLLNPEEAASWRSRLQGEDPGPRVEDRDREVAAGLLGELLEPLTPHSSDAEAARVRAALGALSAVGAVDAGFWDDQLRARLGQPSAAETQARLRELNAGGTEQKLVAVLAAPPGVVDGIRVLYGLRFADGVTFAVRTANLSARRLFALALRDDVGTTYRPNGGGGSADQLNLSFRTAPPSQATWVELVTPAGEAIRVAL